MKGNDETLVIDDREVRITSPAKIFFPERGETKLDLVKHYLRFAEPVMRTMGNRPLLLQRFPEGALGPSFYQKRVPSSAPPWLETTVVTTPNGTESRALVAADLAHMAWAVNLGCLGFHVYVRLEPRWDSYQVRSAAVAVARELERRRPDILTAQWWKEDRGERVFVDFNQNAPHAGIVAPIHQG